MCVIIYKLTDNIIFLNISKSYYLNYKKLIQNLNASHKKKT